MIHAFSAKTVWIRIGLKAMADYTSFVVLFSRARTHTHNTVHVSSFLLGLGDGDCLHMRDGKTQNGCDELRGGV